MSKELTLQHLQEAKKIIDDSLTCKSCNTRINSYINALGKIGCKCLISGKIKLPKLRGTPLNANKKIMKKIKERKLI